jgi:lysophospholipase L1-like esterase
VTNLRRLVLAAASAGVALAVGAALLAARRDAAAGTTLDGDGGELRELLSERSAAEGEEAGPVLVGDIPEEDARFVFASLGGRDCVYDPVLYYRRAADMSARRKLPEHPQGRWTMRTNSQGFREDEELPADADARVLVIGDSHTDGVCDNSESFANRLEALLAERHPGRTLDVVNAGVGGYTFHNYLRGLDAYGEALELDVYVCAVYGGNDFLETLSPVHYLQRTRLPSGGRTFAERVFAFRDLVGKEPAEPFIAQGIQQLAFLTARPKEAELAVGAAADLTRAMAARARELEIDLVFVYVPPLWDVQLERYAEDPAALRRALRVDGEGEIDTADAWAERWMEAVRELELPLVDMRAAFRESPEALYWRFDHHINSTGHRLVAEALLPVVEPLLE